MQEAIQGVIEDLDYSLDKKELKTGDFKAFKKGLSKQKKSGKVSKSKNLLSHYSGQDEATEN